jgi:hypothetical protein
MTRKKKTEKELDELLDEIRFYMAYGIFRTPVKVAKAQRYQTRR